MFRRKAGGSGSFTLVRRERASLWPASRKITSTDHGLFQKRPWKLQQFVCVPSPQFGLGFETRTREPSLITNTPLVKPNKAVTEGKAHPVRFSA